MPSRTVVTRFAPSPTGMFHVGGIRSALYNYLYARQKGGTYILRCEDTDPVRSKKEYEDYFLEVFSWLGLQHDEYYKQSERTAIYKSYIERLIAEDKAYISKEEPKEPGQRAEVIRLRNPGKIVTFHDEVLGDISVDTTDLGDFVIARAIDSPLYHLTVVVDDHEMGVTHIIRGQEHVSNTPRQILIQEAIGATRPIYAHASTILNNERAKLSKRDPLVSPALGYRDQGYLPGAMLNFMALLGWNPGTPEEIFTLEELVATFSIERMQKPGAIFNPDKLEWINKEHIKRLPEADKMKQVSNRIPSEVQRLPGCTSERLTVITPLLLDHISHFGEIDEMFAQGDLLYWFQTPSLLKEKLNWKDETDDTKTRGRLEHVLEILKDLDKWDAVTIKEALWTYATEEGRGFVLWPMRYALTGREKSPDPFTVAGILGKEETLGRLRVAISALS